MNVYLGSLKVIFYLVAWVCGVSFTSSPGLGDGMIYITYSEGVSYYETAPPLRVYSQKTFKQGNSEKQPDLVEPHLTAVHLMDTEVRPSCSNLKRVEKLAGEFSHKYLQIHQQAKLSLRCFKVLVIYMMMTSMCMHLGPDVLKARKMESSMPRQ